MVFMNSKFKIFLYDLFTSFLVTLIINFSVYFFSLKSINFDFLIKYKFYFYWFLLFLFVLAIRFFIKRYIDRLQDDLPRVVMAPYNKFNVKTVYLGFIWVVRFNFLSENWSNIDLQKCKFEDLENIEICDVKGPYCPNDKREMKVTRTYFGRYKYKCPKCKYKNKLLKNHITLVNDTIDEFRSKFR